MPIQVRSKQHTDLHRAELYGPEWVAEPMGGLGVYNGQFDWWKDGVPVGWEIYYAEADGTSEFSQQVGGAAGNYCVRGLNTQANHRGCYIVQRAYMPVDESRNYCLHGAFRGSTVNATCYLGCRCYNAVKAYLGNSDIVVGVGPGLAWTRYDGAIGPAGLAAWQANTRYARVYAYLQYAVTEAANVYIEADDLCFAYISCSTQS